MRNDSADGHTNNLDLRETNLRQSVLDALTNSSEKTLSAQEIARTLVVWQPRGRNLCVRAGTGLGSVCVSFTPVRHRSPASTRTAFMQLADGGGRW